MICSLKQPSTWASFSHYGRPAPSQRYRNSSPMKPGKPGSSTRLRRTWQASGMMARWVQACYIYSGHILPLLLTVPFLTQEGKDIKGCNKLPSQTFSSEYAQSHWRRENTNFTPAASGEISTTPPEPSVRSFPCCKGTSQFQGTQRPHKNIDWSIAFIRSDSWFIFPGRKLLAPAATAATSAMEICIEVH